MGQIKKLYQDNGNVEIITRTEPDAVYPITSGGAVYHSSNWGSMGSGRTVSQILSSLDEGYQYVGVATPSTNPNTYNHKVFYIAGESGVYSHFGSLNVTGLSILKNSGDGWVKDEVGNISGGGGGGSSVLDGYIGTTPVRSSGSAQDLTGISNLYIEPGGKIYFGNTADAFLEYNSYGFHFSKKVYSDDAISAGGISSGGGGGGGGGGEGSTVSISNLKTTGTLIGTLTIDSVGYPIKDGLVWGTYNDTTKTVDLTINGVTRTLCVNGYAAGGGGGVGVETDPTVPSWAKQSSKPTYTASEVGALPASTFIPTKVSDLVNDLGFITTETDPTVASWAKGQTPALYIGSTGVQLSKAVQHLTGIGSFKATLDTNSEATSKIEWDSTNSAWHVYGNLYADGWVSAGGVGSSGGGGGGGSSVAWGTESNNTVPLTVNGVAKTLVLSSALSTFATQSWVTSQNYAHLSDIPSVPAWALTQNLEFSALPSLYIGKSPVQSSAAATTLLGINGFTAADSTAAHASKVVWDSINNAWHFSGNIYADGYISASGVNSGGGSGGGSSVRWVAQAGLTGTPIGVLTIDGTPNTIVAPAGTITGITMNGVNKGTSGVVDLGTVITQHQSLANYLQLTGGTMTGNLSLTKGVRLNLDANGNSYVTRGNGTDNSLYISSGGNSLYLEGSETYNYGGLYPIPINGVRPNLGSVNWFWNNIYGKRWYPKTKVVVENGENKTIIDEDYFIEFDETNNHFYVHGDLFVSGQVTAGQSAS